MKRIRKSMIQILIICLVSAFLCTPLTVYGGFSEGNQKRVPTIGETNIPLQELLDSVVLGEDSWIDNKLTNIEQMTVPDEVQMQAGYGVAYLKYLGENKEWRAEEVAVTDANDISITTRVDMEYVEELGDFTAVGGFAPYIYEHKWYSMEDVLRDWNLDNTDLQKMCESGDGSVMMYCNTEQGQVTIDAYSSMKYDKDYGSHLLIIDFSDNRNYLYGQIYIMEDADGIFSISLQDLGALRETYDTEEPVAEEVQIYLQELMETPTIEGKYYLEWTIEEVQNLYPWEKMQFVDSQVYYDENASIYLEGNRKQGYIYYTYDCPENNLYTDASTQLSWGGFSGSSEIFGVSSRGYIQYLGDKEFDLEGGYFDYMRKHECYSLDELFDVWDMDTIAPDFMEAYHNKEDYNMDIQTDYGVTEFDMWFHGSDKEDVTLCIWIPSQDERYSGSYGSFSIGECGKDATREFYISFQVNNPKEEIQPIE